jgi:AcrR family transcriptional regulator
MGRVAGVSAADTRERLLKAAAEVFAVGGYDGTRVADIASAAHVSNGALYSHFESKAELLVASLRAHGRAQLAELFRAVPDRSISDLLRALGRRLPRRRDQRGALVVEGLVAARRDEAVARLMSTYIGERADWLADLVRVGQSDGDLDRDLAPDAVAHLFLVVALGSALLSPDVHAVNRADWTALIDRLIGALAAYPAYPAPTRAASPSAHSDTEGRTS